MDKPKKSPQSSARRLTKDAIAILADATSQAERERSGRQTPPPSSPPEHRAAVLASRLRHWAGSRSVSRPSVFPPGSRSLRPLCLRLPATLSSLPSFLLARFPRPRHGAAARAHHCAVALDLDIRARARAPRVPHAVRGRPDARGGLQPLPVAAPLALRRAGARAGRVCERDGRDAGGWGDGGGRENLLVAFGDFSRPSTSPSVPRAPTLSGRADARNIRLFASLATAVFPESFVYRRRFPIGRLQRPARRGLGERRSKRHAVGKQKRWNRGPLRQSGARQSEQLPIKHLETTSTASQTRSAVSNESSQRKSCKRKARGKDTTDRVMAAPLYDESMNHCRSRLLRVLGRLEVSRSTM